VEALAVGTLPIKKKRLQNAHHKMFNQNSQVIFFKVKALENGKKKNLFRIFPKT